MTNCQTCGSTDLRPYTCKPPVKGRGEHECTPACTLHGVICWACRMFRPVGVVPDLTPRGE